MARDLPRTALALLGRTDAAQRPVRLLGIGASGLVAASAPRQLDLSEGSWADVERAIATVRDRFGQSAVDRASLTGEGGGHGPPACPRGGAATCGGRFWDSWPASG